MTAPVRATVLIDAQHLLDVPTFLRELAHTLEFTPEAMAPHVEHLFHGSRSQGYRHGAPQGSLVVRLENPLAGTESDPVPGPEKRPNVDTTAARPAATQPATYEGTP